MTISFKYRFRGDPSRPVLAEYCCPEHGVFACLVQRNAQRDTPDAVSCPVPDPNRSPADACGLPSPWWPSVVRCRVKKWEVVRGKYEKPERKTYLDTRNLGEGQDLDEWREERAKIWDERRRAEVKEMLR